MDEPGRITADTARRAAAPFLRAGLAVACVNAGSGVLEADLGRRHAAIVRVHRLIRHCRDFGTNLLVVDLAPPLKPGEAASTSCWEEMELIVREALKATADHGVTLVVKPDLARLNRPLDDLFALAAAYPVESLQFVMDPASYLAGCDPDRRAEGLELVWRQLGSRTAIVHVRDLAFRPEGACFPRPGKGDLDFAEFFRLRRLYQPATPVILSHVRATEIGAVESIVEQHI
jgi:sugar phosphate isomerase/epimerase